MRPRFPIYPLLSSVPFQNIFSCLFDCFGSHYDMGDLHCSLWDLVPWLGNKPMPSCIGRHILNHWTTRESHLPTPPCVPFDNLFHCQYHSPEGYIFLTKADLMLPYHPKSMVYLQLGFLLWLSW